MGDVDHATEARACLEWLGADDITQSTADDPRVGPALGVAIVHSNLAIAQELKLLRWRKEEANA